MTTSVIASTSAFSYDAVYLYSTRDEPGNTESLGTSTILPPNPKRRKHTGSDTDISPAPSSPFCRREEAEDESRNPESDMDFHRDVDDSDESEDEIEDEDLSISVDEQDDIPVIYPRSRFAGHCNVETIKDGESSGQT